MKFHKCQSFKGISSWLPCVIWLSPGVTSFHSGGWEALEQRIPRPWASPPRASILSGSLSKEISLACCFSQSGTSSQILFEDPSNKTEDHFFFFFLTCYYISSFGISTKRSILQSHLTFKLRNINHSKPRIHGYGCSAPDQSWRDGEGRGKGERDERRMLWFLGQMAFNTFSLTTWLGI